MCRVGLLVTSFVTLVPALALAQGSPPPPDPGAPVPPPDPSAPPPPPPPPPAEAAPAPAPAPAPPPTGYYYQPVQPVMYGPPPRPHRSGVTFEANLGLGWTVLRDEDDSDSFLGVGGLSLGIGGWVNQQLAVTARLAGVTFEENDIRFSNIFLGPSLQYWTNDNVWVGGGIGLGIFYATNGDDSDSITGFGMDLRAGYTFNPTSKNTFNASLEVNPGFFSRNNSSGTATGIGLLLGYQHL